jgi:peptidoglycan hydrolase-like protein with peptidoglycan-binding domain
MKDLTTISTDLFNKVRSRFSNVKLGDQAGVVITDPATARFFDLDFTHEGASLGHVNIKLDNDSLIVIYNESMVEGQNADAKNDWYSFLKELRMFAKSNMLNFDTRDITKTNLDKRDYEYLAQENGDTKMSESKLWGTSKTSFQDMGEAKIIVKHSQPVNYNIPAGRTMHIDSIYIENAAGERFRYPHRHLNGARAMATHVANGGTVYDAIGSHISGLSEELSKLRQFKNYTQRNGLQEALSDVSELVLSRISDIKEQISKLQRQNYYAEFAESFAPARELPIPEETVNSWVDALTIRTFNEELKSVFPFIYRLVDQPKALGYEDLVGEGKVCDVCEKDPCECNDEDLEEHNHLEDFEQHLDDITAFEYDVQEPAMAHPAPTQAPNAREVVEFIMSMYDQEQGTFPKGEEGVKIAVEKRFGDQAGQFASQVVERLSTKEQSMSAEGPDFESMQGAIQEAADAATVDELEAAIKKFQQAAGLTVDGKFGPATQKAMQAAKAQQPAQGTAAPAGGAAPAAAPAQGATATAPTPPAQSNQGSAAGFAPAQGGQSAPAAPATPAPAQGGTTNTSTNTNVSGTIKMGKPEGPIQFNGKTVQPGQPEYAAASQALLAQQQKVQQAKQNVGRQPAPSTAPVQQGAANADRRDF